MNRSPNDHHQSFGISVKLNKKINKKCRKLNLLLPCLKFHISIYQETLILNGHFIFHPPVFQVDFSSDPTRGRCFFAISELTCYIWSHRSRAINYCFLHRYKFINKIWAYTIHCIFWDSWFDFSNFWVTQNFFLTQSCQPFSWNKARKVSEKIGCLWAAQRTSAFAKKRIMNNLNLMSGSDTNIFLTDVSLRQWKDYYKKGVRLFPTKIKTFFVLARFG